MEQRFLVYKERTHLILPLMPDYAIMRRFYNHLQRFGSFKTGELQFALLTHHKGKSVNKKRSQMLRKNFRFSSSNFSKLGNHVLRLIWEVEMPG